MPKHPFLYHRPNAEQIKRIERVRQSCMIMHQVLTENCDLSRERSLAITKLEELSMWANKSIVMEEDTPLDITSAVEIVEAKVA